MQKGLFAGFIAGVVVCLLLASIAFGALSITGGDVEAQDAGTWQLEHLGDWPYDTGAEDFVTQVPAECDIMISPHNELLYFYRCPEPWEPVNPFG